MENELILGTTVEEIVYLSIYFGTGLVLASIIKLTCIALKKNLRRDDKNRFAASMIDAVDGAIVLWVFLFFVATLIFDEMVVLPNLYKTSCFFEVSWCFLGAFGSFEGLFAGSFLQNEKPQKTQ